MIDRYTRQEMGRIWTLENRYQAWLDVEVAVCRAWSDMGRIPAEAVENIQAKASIDVDRILAIEEVTRHDVIAFLTSLEEKVGAEAARYIHLGCTSSDIVDTANALLLVQAGSLILKDIRGLLTAIESLANRHKGVLCMGRTHGIHAEPTSFGLKMAGFYAEFERHLARVEAGVESIRVGKISGAVEPTHSCRPSLSSAPWATLSLRLTRTPPRSSSATATRTSLPRWPCWPAVWNACAWNCATCNARKCSRWKKALPRDRRVRRPCRTKRTPSRQKT